MSAGEDETKVLFYETLLNTLESECSIPWVEPIFVPRHPCFENYRDMSNAYERLRLRSGVTDEILEVEEMIDHLLEHGRLLAMEMFRCGMRYQKMQDEKKPGT